MSTPTISNIVLNRTNAFNGKSISNVTGHLLSFKVAYDSSIPNAFVSISMNGSTQQTTLVDNGDTASFELGTFDAGNSEKITATIEITVNDGINQTKHQTYQFDVYKYSPPDVTASVVRNNDEQPVLTFKSSFQATVAGAANSLKQFFARVATGDTTNNTDLKGKTSPQVLTGTYDIGKSYTVYIFIQDQVRPSAILKKVVLPSDIPVMDIGADGKTVTFFGTSPSSATKETLRIGDVASFGEEVVLGNVDGINTFVSGDEYLRLESDGEIHCQSPNIDYVLGKNTILWDANSTGYWMNASHKFTLNQPISKQLTGAVFVWSHYSNGDCDNWWWTSFFVPKQHVAWRPAEGMLMSNPYYGLNKYIYIGDTFIQGADVNQSNNAQNGIGVNNKSFVLRYVLGV